MANKPSTSIDINSAPKKTLLTVKGIGDSLAERIVAGRPYAALSDLLQVSGISEKKLATLRPYLTVKPLAKKPVALPKPSGKPYTSLGHTEAFVFLEDRNERQDAFLIIFGGFILGLIILLLRRSD